MPASVDFCFFSVTQVVPVELTRRPIRFEYIRAQVLGMANGVPIALINYTTNSYGCHFDYLLVMGDDPFWREAEVELRMRLQSSNSPSHLA